MLLHIKSTGHSHELVTRGELCVFNVLVNGTQERSWDIDLESLARFDGFFTHVI